MEITSLNRREHPVRFNETFKDDFHSVLGTVKSLYTFFVLFYVRHHNMYTFRNCLHEVNSKFQNKRHCGCEAVKAFCFVFSHITCLNNFAAVNKYQRSCWKKNLKGLKDKVFGTY